MNNSELLRILVVDDTIVYRKIISDVISQIPNVEVIGTANNGKIALSKIASLKPDLITLDIEMPEMNGIQVLNEINSQNLDVGAIMLSTVTHEGGEMTIKALELGAFDFIPKPDKGTMVENTKLVANTLTPMLKAFTRQRNVIKKLKNISGNREQPIIKNIASDKKATKKHVNISRKKSGKSEIIAIGISTGGPNALAEVIPNIPADIGVPILIVQHMPPLFTNSLAKSLDLKSKVTVKEASDGETILPNSAYIAPGGKQMKIVAGVDGLNRIIRITNDPPENSCKPSVDYLFRSIAHHYIGRSTGVIMTGMGSDGTAGLQLMKKNGAYVIAQDKATCVVFGMPKEPVELNIVDSIIPLYNIANEITNTVKGFKI